MGVSLLRYDNGTARTDLPMPIEMPSVMSGGGLVVIGVGYKLCILVAFDGG